MNTTYFDELPLLKLNDLLHESLENQMYFLLEPVPQGTTFPIKKMDFYHCKP